MHKRRLFPVLVSMVAIALTCHGTDKPLELRLSMPRQTWTEGDDVRLNVELINRMPYAAALDAGSAALVFAFWGDRGRMTEGILLSDFFGQPLVLGSGVRIGREISLPSCPYFDRLFPRCVIAVRPENCSTDELISQTGEYAIQVSLQQAGQNPVLLPARSLPLSYSLESEKIAWRIVSAGTVVARAGTKQDHWQVLAIRSEDRKKDDAKDMDGQRTKLVCWHRKVSMRGLYPGDSWGSDGFGYMPYTSLTEVSDVPRIRLPDTGDLLRFEDRKEVKTIDEYSAVMRRVGCGLCWIAFQSEGKTHVALVGYDRKTGPVVIDKEKTLEAIQAPDQNRAVVLFSEGEGKGKTWHYRIVRDPKGDLLKGTSGDLTIGKLHSLAAFTGAAELTLERKETKISVVDKGANPPRSEEIPLKESE